MTTRHYCAIVLGALGLICINANFAPKTMAQPVQARVLATDPGFKIEYGEEQVGKRMFQVSKMVINTPPSVVFNVLTDYDHTTSIFSNVKKCKVVGRNIIGKLINFQIVVPGNLRFDYVLEVKETYPNLIEWKRVSGAFKANEGYWKLEPIYNSKSTLVTYSKYIDGGILFPQFLVNHEIKKAMPHVMASLKSIAEKSYTVAKAPDTNMSLTPSGVRTTVDTKHN